jgi:hypothetical protein
MPIPIFPFKLNPYPNNIHASLSGIALSRYICLFLLECHSFVVDHRSDCYIYELHAPRMQKLLEQQESVSVEQLGRRFVSVQSNEDSGAVDINVNCIYLRFNLLALLS